MRKSFALLCAAIFFALLISPAVVSEETYKLANAYKQGTKMEFKESQTSSVTMAMPGMPQPTEVSKVTMQKNYVMEVLEVDGGNLAKIKLAYTEYKTTTTAPSAPQPVVIENELKSKIATVTKNKDGKITVECDAKLSDAAKKELEKMLEEDPLSKKLTKDPVPVGYKFTLTKEEMQKWLDTGEVKSCKVDGVFEKVETHNGKKCALVVLNLDLDTKTPEMEGKLTGKINSWFSLDDGIPFGSESKLKMDGKMTIEGMPQPIPVTVTIDGKQEVTLK